MFINSWIFGILLAAVVFAGSDAEAAFRSKMTCGQACALDGFSAKPGTEGGTDASPPCMCMKPKPPEPSKDDEDDEDDKPQTPPPPPGQPPPQSSQPPNSGDDECSQEGSKKDKTKRSCESNLKHSNDVAQNATCAESANPMTCSANGAQAAAPTSGAFGPQSQSAMQDAPVMQAATAYNQAIASSIRESINRCNDSCSKEVQCRQRKIAEAQAKNDMAEVKKQQSKMKKAQGNQRQCQSNESKAMQADASASQFAQALAQALQAAKSASKKKDSTAPQFEEVAPTKSCTAASGGPRDVRCLCDPTMNALFNVRDPLCAGGAAAASVNLPSSRGRTGSSLRGANGDPSPYAASGNLPSSVSGSSQTSGGSLSSSSRAGSYSGGAAYGAAGSGPNGQSGRGIVNDDSAGIKRPIGDGGVVGGAPPPPASAGGRFRAAAAKFSPRKNYRKHGISGVSVPAQDGVTGAGGLSLWQKTSMSYQNEDKKGQWLRESGANPGLRNRVPASQQRRGGQ